jgi:hypothetical protein
MIQSGDIRPASSAWESVATASIALEKDLVHWRKLNAESLLPLNQLLERNKLPQLSSVSVNNEARCPAVSGN